MTRPWRSIRGRGITWAGWGRRWARFRTTRTARRTAACGPAADARRRARRRPGRCSAGSSRRCQERAEAASCSPDGAHSSTPWGCRGGVAPAVVQPKARRRRARGCKLGSRMSMQRAGSARQAMADLLRPFSRTHFPAAWSPVLRPVSEPLPYAGSGRVRLPPGLRHRAGVASMAAARRPLKRNRATAAATPRIAR